MSSIYNNYFLSNKIKVFPCAYRNSTYDATARLNTEYNFTHLPHMVDKASYIIKFNDIPENETTTKLICVIQGYYFEIELGDDDYATLQNKYLNICLASPNGAGSIESPHLCSWESSNIEDTLDGKPEGSTDYCFVGLKISAPTEENPNGKLSRSGYQCYALKLDASAKLPIMANKIEDSAGTGKPISQEFTTETLSATTSTNTQSLNVASDKLIVNSSSITANVPVAINNTLEVKDSTDTSSILKAENDQVVINKPTYITGAGKLTVTAGGADITGATTVSGNLINTNGTFKANKITVNYGDGSSGYKVELDSTSDNIISVFGKISEDDTNASGKIFSVDVTKGVTYAKKIKADNINAQVEGTSKNAINAENVTDTIKGTNITAIFGSAGSTIDELKLKTINPGGASNSENPIKIVVDANSNTAVKFYNDANKSIVKADTFEGNATTASGFSSGTTVKLTGNITGESSSSTKGWIVNTTINKGAVTNDKLANNSVTIGSNIVALGDSIGTSDKPFTGSLYFDKLTVNESPTESNDAVRKHELDNTLWLSGGNGLPNNIDLNYYKTVGNYFHMLAVGSNVTNLPTNADSAFTLKVTALENNDDGTPSFIQQQLRDVSGNVYTRTFTPTGEGVAATWSEWSLVLTSEACMSLPLTRDIAKKYMKIKTDPDIITVSVNALINYVRDNYATDARIQVGDTITTTSTYHGIVIEGLPTTLTEYIIHVDLKSRYSDAWITVENINGKTYQCFWNSGYAENSTTPISGNKPVWRMLPTTGNLNACVDKNNTPKVPDGNIGSASQPVYLTDGVLTACEKVAEAEKADSADKATKDGNGNNISETYLKKGEGITIYSHAADIKIKLNTNTDIGQSPKGKKYEDIIAASFYLGDCHYETIAGGKYLPVSSGPFSDDKTFNCQGIYPVGIMGDLYINFAKVYINVDKDNKIFFKIENVVRYKIENGKTPSLVQLSDPMTISDIKIYFK